MEENSLIYLQNFICNNQELEDLENYYSEFNIFDCIGMSKQEIKHSNFLSWLFNPKENHGMGDYFTKEFLKKVLINSDSTRNKNIPTVFDIDSWNMSEINVFREYNNIDIILKDDINEFICVIENKILAKQSSNQLKKYLDKICNNKECKNYKKLFLYLKPVQDEKITPEYIYVSYNNIVEVINKLLSNKKENLSNSLLLVIENYKKLLMRDIMNDNEIKEICEKIYRNHKKALDIIFKNVGALQNESQFAVAKLLNDFIKNENQYEFVGKNDNIRNICFTHKEFSKYAEIFKFRIWNGIMNEDFSLVIDFLNLDFEKQKLLCNACGIKKIIKSPQNKVSFGKILSKQECRKFNEDFEKDSKISPKWEEKILSNLKNKLNNIDVDKVGKILQ